MRAHEVHLGRRFMDLPMTADGTSADLDVTGSLNPAPPGWYMLFAVDANEARGPEVTEGAGRPGGCPVSGGRARPGRPAGRARPSGSGPPAALP
ncbi:galactose oxidase-like domain-containing protein [Streptomyces sp. CA-251247]|uniref:galactose oxidase-like domain-containing protein n=1 Tax=Streptomyces sp. CA-251247 TaxID=3240062 RepID=UPI003D91699A